MILEKQPDQNSDSNVVINTNLRSNTVPYSSSSSSSSCLKNGAYTNLLTLKAQ
jgi:hypothetical protein